MRRLIAIAAALAVLAVLAGGIACGKKAARATPTPTSGTPFTDGIWYGTFTITVVSGEAACSMYEGAFVDSFVVSGGQAQDLIYPSCSFVTVGQQFTQTCSDTLENSQTCLLTQTMIGTGTVTGNYFSGTWTLTFTKTGSCIRWPTVPNCTFHITGTGTKVPGTSAAEAYRSMPEAFTRSIGKRLRPER